jgi:hypothetical protein
MIREIGKLVSLGAAVLLIAVGSISSQTLQADYQLQGVYTSSVGSIGPLGQTGDTTGLSFVSDTVNSQSQLVLQVQNNFNGSVFTQAGVQAQVAPFVDPTNYSAVLLSNFILAPTNTGITKVMDFKNLSSDAGLYVDDATGLLGFYDGGAMLLGSSSTPIVSGQYVQIVLTRDSSTNLVTVYANGLAQFSFNDSTGFATWGDATNTGNAFLTLFQDDGGGIGGSLVNEGTQGDIARLRLYDGVLSAQDVAGLDTTIPEPTASILLGLGIVAILGRMRRRDPLR